MSDFKITQKDIDELKPYENNPRNNDKAVKSVAKSIEHFGFKVPIVIDKNNVIVCGHTRFKASKKLNLKYVPCIIADDLTDEQIKAFRIADNKTNELAEWNFSKLDEELKSIDFDFSDFDFDFSDLKISDDIKAVEDDFNIQEELEKPEPITKRGDIYKLGNHLLLCGDSTNENDVKKLMGETKADLIFTDPPYGMKKEKYGVLNDNLNFDDLLQFNKKWIALTFNFLKDVGSWYCWGIDEPLMDIYSNILKPMIKNNEITFRNLITWDKGNGQGQMSENFRMYAIADEKCLFVMKGVQGFNTNADNYFEKWEPIRLYLEEQRKLCGWDIPTMKTIAGHLCKSRDHWTGKSQWSLLPEYVYKKFQDWAKENNKDAFKKEYDEIKKEYDEIKKEYYSTRAYFNNLHENMNNVWHFKRTNKEEREFTGNHATPKPIELCARVIKTSSRENEIVLDIFGGSGSTLIACEQLNRHCRMIELDENYCDVIVKRWETFTGKKAELIRQ